MKIPPLPKGAALFLRAAVIKNGKAYKLLCKCSVCGCERHFDSLLTWRATNEIMGGCHECGGRMEGVKWTE
jgi:hypothetical protein